VFTYPADKIRGNLVRFILTAYMGPNGHWYKDCEHVFVSVNAFNFEVNYCEPVY
jgi:hypothetical protein